MWKAFSCIYNNNDSVTVLNCLIEDNVIRLRLWHTSANFNMLCNIAQVQDEQFNHCKKYVTCWATCLVGMAGEWRCASQLMWNCMISQLHAHSTCQKLLKPVVACWSCCYDTFGRFWSIERTRRMPAWDTQCVITTMPLCFCSELWAL